MSGIPAIRTVDLTRHFGDVRAVSGISFEVGKGEIFGLVGPDGAGKTTTMRMLAGILDPTSGELFVDGVDVARNPEFVKESIGYMSQRFGLYTDLTVMENIEFYADLYGVPRRGRDEKIDALLGFSNLTPFKRRRADHLSGGMKQKLGLACALVHTPRVLLLDEPTNGVDPVSRRDFWRILYRLLKEQVTIFVSTSYLDEAERCNRVALLHQGKLLACDSVEGVKTLLKGDLLEVRCDRLRQASARLGESGLGRVAVFGDRIHILVADAASGSSAVEARLKEGGFGNIEVRPAEVSLEDVFTSALPDGGKGIAQ